MTYLQVVSAVLFLISIGSMSIHRTKNADAMIENSFGGKLLLTVFSLIPFVFLTIVISNIGNLKWYWSFIISIIIIFMLSGILTDIYSSILGYKSKPSLSLRAGGHVRYNLHIFDAIITFVLGLILYIVFWFNT